MIKLRNMNMKSKLTLLFLLTGIVPLVVVGWWSSYKAADALMDNAFSELKITRSLKKNQIENFFRERLQDIEILAESADTRLIIKEFFKYHHDH